MKLRIDFIFSNCAVDYLHGQVLIDHLTDLASVMSPGGVLLFPGMCNRPEMTRLMDLFDELGPYPAACSEIQFIKAVTEWGIPYQLAVGSLRSH